MIIRNKFNGYVNGNNRLYPGGGGGPTYTKSETSNIPEYAQPYVERMMGATEKQIYTYGPKGNITGFQPYKPFEGETVAGFTPMQKQAMQGIGNYQLPGQTGAATQMTGIAGLGAMSAGQNYQSQAFNNAFNRPQEYNPAQFSTLMAQAPNLQQYQMGPAERVRTQSFARPGAVDDYMSPYQQAVTNVEKREATRASNIMQQQQQAQAVQQGAFGGSRSAIVEAERQRNLEQQLGDIQTRGSQSAFQQAQQQFNAEQQARLQAQMANQQAGLTTGQQNLQAVLGVQQLGAGQDLQSQLANQQAYQQALQQQEQSRQFGYGQNLNAAQLQAQYGLSAQQAAEQSRQFGADLGMRGYGQGLQAAGQLGALGQQQYGQEMGLLGQQYDIGAKQQAYEQQRLNQIIQDYATQQQYPFIQLGTLSNMLRGLPMQASTTQMYQAQPPALQQAVGLAGAGANLYQAMKAEGGAIKEMASGGIASGADPYKLPGMMKKLSDEQLQGKLGGDTDPETMGIAQAEKQRRDQVRKGMPGMAGGGAVAFKKGGIDTVNREDTEWAEDKKPEEKKAGVKKAPAPKAPAPKAPAPASSTPYQDMARQQLTALDTPPPEVKEVRESVKDLKERVKGGVEGEMNRRQEIYQKFGVDPTKLIAEERARQQEELRMSEEDYRKSQHLRYAQMFARFGSTPGPVLKAALVSINEVVPDLLDDKAKANAVRREIKKAMFELDKSEYQEKKGNVDKAAEAHENAVARITSLNMELGKMVTDTELKKADITGGMARTEVQTQSAEKISKEEQRTRRDIAAAQERGAERRHQATESRIALQEKRREDSNTRDYQAALSKGDKDSGYYEKREQLGTLIQHGTPESKEGARQELIKLEKEREERKAELRRMYPDARTGEDKSAASSTVDTSGFTNFREVKPK